MNKQEKHLTNDELAERLNLHPNTLCNWRRMGKGPRYITAGSKILYCLSDIEAWENSNKHGGGAKDEQRQRDLG